MSHQIDFLPARYREQKVRRRSRLWLLSILGVFVSVIAITSTVQMTFYKDVKNQLTTVKFQHSAAEATQNMHDRLQSDLARARASASLYAYLQSNWPRTQIILAVSRPLTDEITISELTVAIEAEPAEGRGRESSRRRGRQPETKQVGGLPARRDLDALRKRMADKRTVVHLSGKTTDDVALHRYVSRLNGDTLFDKAELMSFESSSGDGVDSAEFVVRVIVTDSTTALTNARAAIPQDAESNREEGLR